MIKTSDYECKYKWKATFNDGTTLEQFDVMGSEINFRLVTERLEHVRQFEFLEGTHDVILDLVSGFFYVNGVRFIPSHNDEQFLAKHIPKRLIFFRTVIRSFGQELENSGISVYYCIGWQATVDGKNFKHILRIAPDNSIIYQ